MKKINQLSIRGLVFSLLLIICADTAFAFTKNGTQYTTDGSQADVQLAINDANAGDTVNIPEGTYIWGTNGTFVYINTPIILQGAGTNATTIWGADNAAMFGDAVIRINSSSTVRNFTYKGWGWQTSAFATGNVNGWRISDVLYIGNLHTAYFAFIKSYGVIDQCTIIGAAGNAELIFARGPIDSWQTVSSIGTSNAVYVENCVFNGPGYVCDANSNARFVVRFCTITGNMKIDGHGKASNTPPRGVRHMEIYGNRWTSSGSYWTAMELRGGSGMVFDNQCSGDGGSIWFLLRDYGYDGQWPNFGNVIQTPTNYPVDDQIGVGMDPKAAGSEPMYLWNNTASSGSNDWILTWKQIPKAAIDLYKTQTGNPNATFTMETVIAANRDYFKGTNGVTFTGSGGVGRGTKAQMNGITPTKKGVGFWVTDEGDWNTKNPGPDGCLYVWSGTAWEHKYTPFHYPYDRQKPLPPTNLRKE